MPTCSFCRGRSGPEGVVAGPGEIYICRRCVEESVLTPVAGGVRGFCGLRGEDARGMVEGSGRGARICDACVELCSEIFAEQGAGS